MMTHICGGELDFVSITKVGKNKVEVFQICPFCGKEEKTIQYLYEDEEE